MRNMKALNRKEVKKLLSGLESQYGAFTFDGFAFFRNNEGKVFLISRDIDWIDESKVRINNFGLYFGKDEKGGFRMTLEGIQLIRPKKNVISVDREQAVAWMRGEDIEVSSSGAKGYVALKVGGDFIGCGRFKEGVVLNSVPKGRRITGISESGMRTVKN